tara:strand:+ start:235 stop:666 length:432 start_codon:yes stop_codon:yes gene_type:complete
LYLKLFCASRHFDKSLFTQLESKLQEKGLDKKRTKVLVNHYRVFYIAFKANVMIIPAQEIFYVQKVHKTCDNYADFVSIFSKFEEIESIEKLCYVPHAVKMNKIAKKTIKVLNFFKLKIQNRQGTVYSKKSGLYISKPHVYFN